MKEEKKESIFTPKRTVKFFFVSLITMAIVAMIVWPLMDMLFSKIDNSNYSWTVRKGIVEPCIFAVVVTIVEFVGWNFFHKKK